MLLSNVDVVEWPNRPTLALRNFYVWSLTMEWMKLEPSNFIHKYAKS